MGLLRFLKQDSITSLVSNREQIPSLRMSESGTNTKPAIYRVP